MYFFFSTYPLFMYLFKPTRFLVLCHYLIVSFLSISLTGDTYLCTTVVFSYAAKALFTNDTE